MSMTAPATHWESQIRSYPSRWHSAEDIRWNAIVPLLVLAIGVLLVPIASHASAMQAVVARDGRVRPGRRGGPQLRRPLRGNSHCENGLAR